MANGLKNAGFLDRDVSGVPANWTAGTGTAMVVDETEAGGPGRAVLVVNGTASSLTAHSDPVACSVGQVIEAAGGIVASAGTVELAVEFLNGAGGSVIIVPLPVQQQPSSGRLYKRGLRNRFGWSFARITAPSSAASARLVIAAAAVGGAYWAGLLKPFLSVLDAADVTSRRQPWDPGAHDNVDLNLPVWPSTCGNFDAGGQFKPTANMSGFSTDANIEAISRLYQDVETDWTFRVRCTPDMQDDIEAFFADRMAPSDDGIFYVVKPDTDQLCFASWTKDGQPHAVDGKGPTVMIEGGLHLKVT